VEGVEFLNRGDDFEAVLARRCKESPARAVHPKLFRCFVVPALAAAEAFGASSV